MNCPRCGRPISAKANICPRCKEKIYHNPNNPEETTQEENHVSIDGRPIKRRKPVIVDILLILLCLVVLAVIFCLVVPNVAMNLIKDIEWLNWLSNLLADYKALLG